MLSCGIAIFLSSPTNNTFAKTILVVFIIFTFFLFGLLSVLAWVFFNKNYFTVSTSNLSNDSIERGWRFWGFALFKFMKIRFTISSMSCHSFDSVIQLLN